MMGFCLLLSLTLVGFSFSRSWPLSLALIVFIGLGQTGKGTLSDTLIQNYTEPDYLGRVWSITHMQFGLISFGTFAAGLLADSVGVQWAVGGFAMALAILSILVLAFVPRIRNLE